MYRQFILAFLDHLKPKIFFVGQPWWPTLSAPFFKISGSAPASGYSLFTHCSSDATKKRA